MAREWVVDVRPLGPAFRIDVDLGDIDEGIDPVTVGMRFRWLERLQRWQWFITLPNGTRLSPAMLVQAGAQAPISRTSGNHPEGYLEWRGPDDYGQADLGTNLRLIYVAEPRPRDGGFLVPPP